MNKNRMDVIYHREEVLDDHVRLVGRVTAHPNKKLVQKTDEDYKTVQTYIYCPGVITFKGTVHEGRKINDYAQHWMGYNEDVVFHETIEWTKDRDRASVAAEKAQKLVDETFEVARLQHEWVNSRLVEIPDPDDI